MAHTIQSIIQDILSTVPGAPFDDTVDTIKTGDGNQEVTSIVTTFLANYELIQKAAVTGSNFIITHEPTFYNHRDEIDWLADDPVYLAKRRLLDENHIVVWRFHDHWHAHQPDGILTGGVSALGWEAYQNPEKPALFNVPTTSLSELARYLKIRLGIKMLRMVGDPALSVQKVGFLAGGWGGGNQINLMGHEDVDVLIAGEIAEWDIAEYVRDANAIGLKKALIVTGHQPSEEPGMAYFAQWLKKRFPDIPITHVPAGSPLTWL